LRYRFDVKHVLAVALVGLVFAASLAAAEPASASPCFLAGPREVAAVSEISAPHGRHVPSDDDCALCESVSTDLVEPPVPVALDLARDSASPAADPVAGCVLGFAASVNQARAPPEIR
jgi:hypothetical protein